MSTVLIRPILTEKATLLAEKENQYVFEVGDDASPNAIAKAIESRFSVTVTSVRTVNKKGKAKIQFTRKGVRAGRKSDERRAYVTLAKGNKIDYYGAQNTTAAAENK
ncbi:MAG: 50S ribosomal protein L23 [Chloroherpetonaceae bacterium]|nr:50S ribosomal protein L23 [Chloroherpetonaceae bacterium]